MEVIKGAGEYDLTHACTTKEEVYSHYDHTNFSQAHRMGVIKGAREYDLTHACTTKEEVYSHYDHTNFSQAHRMDYGNHQRCT